jgi:hypothetical protein
VDGIPDIFTAGVIDYLVSFREEFGLKRKRALAGAVRSVISTPMDQEVKAPKLSGTAKLDATTEAAYAIIDKHETDREAKTAKLKTLRLEKEAAERGAEGSGRKSKRAVKPAHVI